jgi:hypothetical protein
MGSILCAILVTAVGGIVLVGFGVVAHRIDPRHMRASIVVHVVRGVIPRLGVIRQPVVKV